MSWKSSIQRLSLLGGPRKSYERLKRVPLLGILLKKWARASIPTGVRVWTRVRSGRGAGLWVHLDPRFESCYLERSYEAEVTRALLAHLAPGGVFYDVGAHIGLFSLIAARHLAGCGCVFAFEPDPVNFQRIEEHASRNGIDSIHVVTKAVWSSGGRMRFLRDTAQSSRNRGSLTEESFGDESAIEVETISLDDFAHAHEPPTVIKIDVEGAEAHVLGSCRDVLSANRPVIVCEIHNEDACQSVTKLLRRYGYAIEWLEGSDHFPRHLLAKA